MRLAAAGRRTLEFQSTPLREGRHGDPMVAIVAVGVSIHAPA